MREKRGALRFDCNALMAMLLIRATLRYSRPPPVGRMTMTVNHPPTTSQERKKRPQRPLEVKNGLSAIDASWAVIAAAARSQAASTGGATAASPRFLRNSSPSGLTRTRSVAHVSSGFANDMVTASRIWCATPFSAPLTKRNSALACNALAHAGADQHIDQHQ